MFLAFCLNTENRHRRSSGWKFRILFLCDGNAAVDGSEAAAECGAPGDGD